MHFDLLEVHRVALDRFDVREAASKVGGQGDPQTSIELCASQHVPARCLVQDGLGGASHEEPRETVTLSTGALELIEPYHSGDWPARILDG